MNDYELEQFCKRNPDCGCDCLRCPAFAKNQMEELGLNETDPCEDEEANYTPPSPAYDYSLDSW